MVNKRGQFMHLAQSLPARLFICLFLWSAICSAHADDQQGYRVDAGDNVFVMMSHRCVNEPVEIVISRQTFDHMSRANTELAQNDADTALAVESNAPADSCLRKTLSASPEIIEELDGAVRVRIAQYESEYSGDVFNESGQPYPASGLYRSGGYPAHRPLWTVDWYATEVILLYGGKYLVRRGPWTNSYDELALAFYEDGRFKRQYPIAELVREPDRLPRWSSHFAWIQETRPIGGSFFMVSTFNRELYVFALSTGDIVARSVADNLKQYTVTLSARIQSEPQGTVPTLTSGRSRERITDTVKLFDFRTCGGMMTERLRESKGAQVSRHFFGMDPAHVEWGEIQGNVYPRNYAPPAGESYVSIPFDDIEEIRPAPTGHFQITPMNQAMFTWDGRPWVVTRKNGEKVALIIDGRYLFYCARTLDGAPVVLTQRQLESVVFE